MAKKDCNVKSFILYTDQAAAVSKMSDDQKGKLLQAIFDWQLGKDVQIDDPIVDVVFSFFEQAFIRDAEKYATKVAHLKANANKRKQKEANANNCNQIDGVNVNDNVNVNVNVNDSINNNPPMSPQGEESFSGISDLHPDARSAVEDFIENRKQLKSPMTQKAVTRLINKLRKLFGSDFDKWRQSVDQSIMHRWTDVYEIKNSERRPLESSHTKLDMRGML